MTASFQQTRKIVKGGGRPSSSCLPEVYPTPYAGTVPRAKNTSVVVIRRELVELTGDHFSAVILNQLLYWTQRVKDFDLLLEEEKNFHPECNVSLRHGWIYKTAYDLIEETMLGISHPTIRKYIKLLIMKGWIDERSHPANKWNKTTQYRVNLRKLQEDLVERGHTLPEAYLSAFDSSPQEDIRSQAVPDKFISDEPPSTVNNLQAEEKLEALSQNTHNLQPVVKNFHSNERILHSSESSLHSNERNLHSYTYTENTPKTTNKEHTQRAGARVVLNEHSESEYSKSGLPFLKTALDLWKLHVRQEISLTEERKQKLHSLLARHFQKDLGQWERFCERVKSSPFLMGEGPRKWRVSFDWILCEENLLKVREGNFDNPEALSQKAEKFSETTRTNEIHSILASIEDPLWKEWCSQLDFSPESRHSVSLGELKEIANARFLEIEDDRLVWIESSDKRTLDCIENLRMKMLPLIQKTFPNTRNLRTRLKEPILARKEVFSSIKDIRSRSETGLSRTELSKIRPSNPTHSQQRIPSKGTHLMTLHLMGAHLMRTNLTGETHA